VPGDIAQITTASLVHRRSAGGRGATGHGIVLAIVDSGFAHHPWFDDHAFDITRVAAPDTAHPEVDDDDPHGTHMLAPLLSCAPDASVLAVKFGEDFKLAFDLAANAPGVRVISLSLTFPQSGSVLSEAAAGLVLPILSAIGRGITVVAAAGNGDEAFPAMMPEVIAVGGLEIDRYDGLQHWPLSSSFTSPIYPGRPVPDICGLASLIQFPTQGGNQWDASLGGTSAATTQVAAVAALLLEKRPHLMPAQVRSALMATAQPVGGGKAGMGIVDAKAAWDSV
jgi:subtilisin family serine protease